jgi:acyl-CoA dehydrogenase
MGAETAVQAPAGADLDGDGRVMAPSVRAANIAQTVAAHADDVDRDARFPAEALEALREQRLLSALIPVDLGGDGASIAEIGACVEVLGQHCASTAMIYAMHQIQVACPVLHGL